MLLSINISFAMNNIVQFSIIFANHNQQILFIEKFNETIPFHIVYICQLDIHKWYIKI